MSTFADTDLAGIMVAPDRELVGFAEGIIRSWDAGTFHNTVSVRGSDLHDLPVASGVEALTYAPGDVVTLTRWKPRSGRGVATYRIGMSGRVIFPGTGAAEKTIAFMTTALATSILDDLVEQLITSPAGGTLIRGLIGRASETDFESTQVDTGSTDWEDLGGPSVSVDVGDSGRALVEFGAVVTTTPGEHAAMSFEVSGATSQPPSGERSIQQQTDSGSAVVVTQSAAVLVTGLNEGTHTFAARYTTFLSTGDGFWSNRYLIVTPY